MTYSKVALDLGDLHVKPGTTNATGTYRLPGDFGCALSLVVSLNLQGIQAGGSCFWWWLLTGFDDGYWHFLSPDSGGSRGTRTGRGGIRMQGPFADCLALGYGFKYGTDAQSPFEPGTARGVEITIGMLTI